MRKRIRRHQVQIGMFVDELEYGADGRSRRSGGFIISGPTDMDRVLGSKVISLVIDTDKGADVGCVSRPPGSHDPGQPELDLLSRHSAEEIREAQETIRQTTPLIRQLFLETRLSGEMRIGQARRAADHIISTAQGSSAAMIGITRLKTKDEYAFLHSLAVSALMVSFGRALALGDDLVGALAVAGLVHDIGKVAVPRSLLTKAGKLTEQEFNAIKTHPVRGYELLAQFGDLPSVVLDICLHHHERYDGSGYPHGLAGTAIPFAARLATICDVYEAMTTVRPYKKAWSQAQAIDLMLRSSGHFDPTLLSAFVSKMVITGAIA